MILTLDLSDREAEILAELRRSAFLLTDADVVHVAVFRLAREFNVEGLDPTDFAPSTGRRARTRAIRSTRNT